MPLQNITGPLLVAATRKAADMLPHKKAAGQYFNPEGDPCCLIGTGLAHLGVIARELDGHDDDEIASLVRAQLPSLRLDIDVASLEWLNAAQEAQDSGKSWRQAVAHADETTPIEGLAS